MKNRYLKVRTIVCLGFFVVIFSSWDAFYPPHIINYYEHVIELEVVFDNFHGEDSVLDSIILESGVGFGHRHEGTTCVSMKVYSKDGVLLADYPEDVITELKTTSLGAREYWILNEKGVFLIPKAYTNNDEEYLEMLYATMKHNCGSKVVAED